SGERVLGELFETGAELQNLFATHVGEGDDIGDDGLSVGEGPGFVKEHGANVSDLFEDDGFPDDDAAPGSQRDGADDGNGNCKQQGARGGDDDDGKKALRLAAQQPSGKSNGHGDGRVEGSETIGEPANFRRIFFGLSHDLHDARITGINGELVGND